MNQLPPFELHSAQAAITPKQGSISQGLRRNFGVGVFNGRQQVHAVNRTVCRQFCTSSGHQCGCEIKMRSRLLELLPGRNLGWPLHGGGHTQTAFKKGEFPTAIGLVHIRDTDVTGCAVVARKNDQSILINAVVLQCLKHAAHTSIDRPNHGAINSPTVVLNLGQSVVVFFAGLKGRVNTPVRQVHEERSVFVFANGVNSFIGKVVCEVPFGLKPFTPVEAHAKTHVGP